MIDLSFGKNGKIPNYFKSSDMAMGIVVFDPGKCSACGVCVAICPAQGLKFTKREDALKKRLPALMESAPGVTLCMGCGDCAAACPGQAISVKRGFNAGLFFRRLAQEPTVSLPKKY
ncbi:MAG: 4Fe-4S binding protein [Smithellaceae bacterium]|nr:4Fe-4S binding protein [Smithellaceae bacterium]